MVNAGMFHIETDLAVRKLRLEIGKVAVIFQVESRLVTDSIAEVLLKCLPRLCINHFAER